MITDQQQQSNNNNTANNETKVTTQIRVADPLPPTLPAVPDEIRKKFAAPRIQVLAQLPKSHRTVWLAGFSPLLSPNVRTTRSPKGLMFALGNLGGEELARAVPILLLDKPLCLHFAKYGACQRPDCASVCTHRDELQIKTFIGVRYSQLQQLTKSDVKKMVQQTLKEEDIEVQCQIPKRFVYYKDADKDYETNEDGVIGEGGYTETGQRRMRTEDEGDELLESDKGSNVMFENDAARDAYMEQRAQEHEARRRRLINAAKVNAKNIPALPVLPPDVELWWKEKQIINTFNEQQGLPPITSTTLLEMEKQNQRDPSEVFPPIPNISYADSAKGKYLHPSQAAAAADGGSGVGGSSGIVNSQSALMMNNPQNHQQHLSEEAKMMAMFTSSNPSTQQQPAGLSEEAQMLAMFNQPLADTTTSQMQFQQQHLYNNNNQQVGGGVSMFPGGQSYNNNFGGGAPITSGGTGPSSYQQQQRGAPPPSNRPATLEEALAKYRDPNRSEEENIKLAERHFKYWCSLCGKTGHTNTRCRENPACADRYQGGSQYGNNNNNNNRMPSGSGGGGPQAPPQPNVGNLDAGNFGML